MRVLLVGRAEDRDRLRRELRHAGVEIVAELATASEADALHHAVDAIVTATGRLADTGGGVSRARERSGFWEPGERARERGRGGNEVPPLAGESLTARELDVLALMAEGLPNKAIAQALGISDQTVKFHVAAIIGKLGAANRTDAVRRAIRRGLVAI